MKKSILSSFLLMCCISFFAQSPEFINYQGVLRDANGNILSNTNIKTSSKIEIDAGGTSYTNSFPAGVITNAYGLFSARILLNSNIDWNNTGVKIRSTIEYDANGAPQSIQGSWEDLSSVPYALYANEVKNYPETGNNGEYLKWDASANNGNGSWVSSAVNSGNTLPLSATIGQVLTWNGVEWVAQDNDGVDDADASVTNELSNLSISGNTLSLTNPLTSGNSVTIPTELPSSGTDNDVLTWDATTNSWVAQANDGYEANTDNQNLSNVLTQGNSAGSTKITDLSDPTNAQDASTKLYVDNLSVNGSSDYCDIYEYKGEDISGWSETGTSTYAGVDIISSSTLSCAVRTGSNAIRFHGFSELITQNYTVNSCKTVKISFYEKSETFNCQNGSYYCPDPPYTDYKLYIYYSTNNGSSWTQLGGAITKPGSTNAGCYQNGFNLVTREVTINSESTIKFKIKSGGLNVPTGSDWFLDDITISSSLNGQTTNGSGPIDYRSLWYSNNGVITSKNASDVEISGGFKLTSGSPSLGKFLQSSDANGTASWASVPSYSLPMASSTTLGGVKVGSGLLIDNNGFLSTNLSNGTEMLTENGNTGIVRSGRDNNYYGNIGNNATDFSVPIATSTIKGATGGYSTAMGTATRASGIYSTAMGIWSEATGAYSTAFGTLTEASGNYSTAMGNQINSKSFNEIALGSFNTDYTPNSATTWDSGDRLFVVGNGYNDYSRSDALVILKNGNTGIGTSSPQHTLDVNGDARIGWNGNSNYIYVSPLQLKGTTSNSNWELTNSSVSNDYSYGGQIRFFDGSDAYFSFFIPVGYKMTGYDFYFGNYPDYIDVYTSGISGYGVTAIDSRGYSNAIPSYGTASRSSLNLGSINSSSNYVIIHFTNDNNNQLLFKGGRIAIERM